MVRVLALNSEVEVGLLIGRVETRHQHARAIGLQISHELGMLQIITWIVWIVAHVDAHV